MKRFLVIAVAGCAFVALPVMPSVSAPLGSPLKAISQTDGDSLLVKGGGGHVGVTAWAEVVADALMAGAKVARSVGAERGVLRASECKDAAESSSRPVGRLFF